MEEDFEIFWIKIIYDSKKRFLSGEFFKHKNLSESDSLNDEILYFRDDYIFSKTDNKKKYRVDSKFKNDPYEIICFSIEEKKDLKVIFNLKNLFFEKKIKKKGKTKIFLQFYGFVRPNFESDSQLAKKLNLSKSHLLKYIADDSTVSPSLTMLEKWCKILEIEIAGNIFRKKTF